MVHSDSMSPTSPGIWSKLSRRWEYIVNIGQFGQFVASYVEQERRNNWLRQQQLTNCNSPEKQGPNGTEGKNLQVDQFLHISSNTAKDLFAFPLVQASSTCNFLICLHLFCT
ncbi:hypothetical protein ILYODFUR_023965 [Ilyodon furcidens]|uniref:Uncharacterized protein n=1 Tax=Ilyodon furcidens TaxID=33524 RepID=A0ABV0U989_9TELE